MLFTHNPARGWELLSDPALDGVTAYEGVNVKGTKEGGHGTGAFTYGVASRPGLIL